MLAASHEVAIHTADAVLGPPILTAGTFRRCSQIDAQSPGQCNKGFVHTGTLVCVSMYVHNHSRFDTHVITFLVLYVYIAKAPLT